MKISERKIRIGKKAVPLMSIIMACMLMTAGIGIGAIVYRRQVQAGVTVVVNAKAIEFYEDDAYTTPMNGGFSFTELYADNPNSGTERIYYYVRPVADVTTSPISCYLTMSGGNGVIDIDWGYHVDGTHNPYSDIDESGATSFYTFPSGWDASTDDPIYVRAELQYDAMLELADSVTFTCDFDTE